jgi:hypothetical protein
MTKLSLSENFSMNVYAAVYSGINNSQFESGFDVVGWTDDCSARPVSPGVVPNDAIVIFQNVSESDFGSESFSDYVDEDEFVDTCMKCFDCIEVEIEDVD